ncbi:MAG: antibiotic biosynthesis monooxygenase family protein [Caulobacterales bacterium]
MVIERAEIPVKPGMEEEFAKVMADSGIALLASAAGCNRVEVGRGVESPGKFILLLSWDKVQSHIDFTKTPAFDNFKSLAGPFFAGPSNMEHFELV